MINYLYQFAFGVNVRFDFDFKWFICSFINVHLNIIIERT
jgi:hypothetical protein